MKYIPAAWIIDLHDRDALFKKEIKYLLACLTVCSDKKRIVSNKLDPIRDRE
jgi:hypothetical protein